MDRLQFTPIIEEIVRPPHPTSLYRTIKDRPYSFFLDSALHYKDMGRYSFLGCDPFLIFKSKKDRITLADGNGCVETRHGDPFSALKEIMSRYKIAEFDSTLPFISGGVGYFSYDLKDHIEVLPDVAVDDLGMPEAIFCFYDVVIIYDHAAGKTCIASSGLPETDEPARRTRSRARLEACKADLDKSSLSIPGISGPSEAPCIRSNFSKENYVEAIRKAKEYIRRGDIYQVNLSQRFEAALVEDPYDLYLRLRNESPAPFGAYLNYGDIAILSSSPERFLFKRGDYIETRPIKGTRPRGEDAFEDARLEGELVASAKDRAEHVMIVDLERNDLGRVCEYGSVFPTEFVSLEKYATVFHLVSTVSGKIRKDADAIDCLKAAFPGGSITGAPKIRSMEIIEELEQVKRAVYTGAIGYIDFRGNMDTSIVIRTFLVKGGKVYFQVGGGIVADSDPEAEYEETLHKARGAFRALGADKHTHGVASSAVCEHRVL